MLFTDQLFYFYFFPPPLQSSLVQSSCFVPLSRKYITSLRTFFTTLQYLQILSLPFHLTLHNGNSKVTTTNVLQTEHTCLKCTNIPKTRVARITSTMRQSYDLYETWLTWRGSIGAKVYHSLSTNSFKTCGSPEALTVTTIYKKYRGETISGEL